MDTCVICGKSQNGIILNFEDDDGNTFEKHVCNSCSEFIASIALQVVASEVRPLINDLEPLLEFVATFKKLDSEDIKFQERISEIEKSTSKMAT